MRTDLLEDAVWADVCALLSDPERVEAEFRRRLDDEGDTTGKQDLDQLRKVAASLKRGIARLIDAYSDGLLDKSEFQPRTARAKERLHRIQTELKESVERENQKIELKVVVTRMEDFSKKVRGSLLEADWDTRREILRSIVKRVEVEEDKVRVVYRVDPRPFVEGPSRGRSQHCWRRDFTLAQ